MKKVVFTFLVIILSINIATTQEEKVKEKKKWKFGLHFDNLSADQKAFNAETNGVIINKVSEDHPAEAAGILVGDILTHVDTIAIQSQDHCVQVMKDFDTSKGLAMLKIIRNGVKMDIKVKFE